ncbi:lysozyme [Stutzerimonas nitrititolerans]|uniref:lysozyme n=1 Tax=Stutzerimonas nitrititolerans TaxID=2482751 RepID=UPI0028A63A14|nr:lysozyme [Stutzerimonas nitrititolerans]
MQTSQRGIDLIKTFEGLRLAAYDDGVGVQTIGYGHTKGVKPGMTITADQAVQFLREDLHGAERDVERYVTVHLCQHQFDALASLVFNIGGTAFRDSTLLRKLNAGDYAGAAVQFDRWVHGGGKILPGLVKRRAAERAMFEDAQ